MPASMEEWAHPREPCVHIPLFLEYPMETPKMGAPQLQKAGDNHCAWWVPMLGVERP